jgi:hypothetical protein
MFSLRRWWSAYKLLNLSRPAGHRPLYKAVRGAQLRSVLDFEFGHGDRARTLIAWLKETSGQIPVRYVAVDRFEAQPGGLPLKSAHRLLTSLGTKPLLVPDEPAAAMPRVAHTIGAVDLLICPSGWSAIAASPFLNRVVHERTIVLASEVADAPLGIHPVTAETLSTGPRPAPRAA